jgi:hypothetical protein
MPAIGHGMDLLRGEVMHILGAAAEFLDPIGDGRAIRPKIVGAGMRCNVRGHTTTAARI